MLYCNSVHMVNAYRKDQYVSSLLTDCDFQYEWCNISKRVNRNIFRLSGVFHMFQVQQSSATK
jgi:hypothetical protein